LEREIRNQRIITEQDFSYPVLSPKDLSGHKLSRICVFSEKYEVKIPQGYSYDKLKSSADMLREEITTCLGNVLLEDVAKL